MVKVIHIIVLNVAVFCLFACQKKENAESLVREWVGKEITFQDDAVYTVQGDTVQYDPAVNDFNIIVYVDSAGCTECKTRMPAWNAFMAEINQYDSAIGLCFVTDGVDADAMTQLTKHNDFRYPILTIANGQSDFPKEHLYQTLLLDKSNQVLAIGNPIGSESIARLYRRIMNVPDKASQTADIHSNLVFSAKRIPLGAIRLGEERRTQVLITNNGDSSAVIPKITTSCQCTSAKSQSDTIYPGHSIALDIAQRNDSTFGPFSRDVYVYISDISDPVQIELTGFMSNQSLQ